MQPGVRRRTKQLACSHCRQSKIKCVRAGQGLKCQSCQQKGLVCEIDPDYRRINHSSKLSLLSSEVRRLREALTSSGGHDEHAARPARTTQSPTIHSQVLQSPGDRLDYSSSSHNFSATTVGTEGTTLPTSPFENRIPMKQSPNLGRDIQPPDELPELCATQYDGGCSLGGVSLTTECISKLFQSFFQHFHPHFPILNEELQPLEYHERSPLLFWTIIVIAARSYRERPSLRTDLSKPVTDLLWTKISAIPPSHFTIQAEMLLCVWPFSPHMLIADTTLFMASIVKAGCTQLGLHQPDNMQDYNRIRFQILNGHVDEAVKLWAACFITAESITSANGYTPLFNAHDPVLRRASAMNKLPWPLGQVLKIQMVLNRLHSTTLETDVRGSSERPLYGALIASFEHELNQLEEDLCTRTHDDIAIWLLSARLQTQALYFLEPPESRHRRPGLLRAFQTGVELIKLLHTANTQLYFNRSAPLYFGSMLKLAVLVILRLYYSSYSAVLDEQEVNHYFDMALNLHHSMIVEKNDFHDRATILLPELRNIFGHSQDLQRFEPSLQVRTRQSASLLHDSHWIWRDYYAAKSVDTQQLGRPPRILPSIIQYSPASGPATDGDVTEQHPVSPAGQHRTEGNSNVSFPDTHIVGSNVARPQSQDLPSGGHPQNSDNCDSLPDPLDMMYTFLDPSDDLSALFYPPWSLNSETSQL